MKAIFGFHDVLDIIMDDYDEPGENPTVTKGYLQGKQKEGFEGSLPYSHTV